ncbi:MAG: Proline/betaine transporter [Chlamydiae bacterium]|nr:Proline/betaine transporter [Chlamydiota bacterium]
MSKIKKIYVFCSIGNTLEFYDFALYGFYAQIFSKLFIPSDHALTSLFVIYGVFAIGFLSRPVGGFLFGYLGDKYGRKNALSLSLAGIGIATFGIAILPTYQSLGILAPILLTLLRILQGLSLGGEWTNSLVFISEYLSKYKSRRPAFTTGVVTSMGVFGWFLASVLASLFSSEDIFLLSWRIPFFFGSFVAVLGIYFRKHIDDAYYEKTSSSPSNHRSVLSYPKSFIKVAAIGCLVGAVFYSQFIFTSSFLPLITSFSSKQVNNAISFGLFSYMVFLPVMGFISDQYGHKKTMICSAFLILVFSPLLLYWETTNSLPLLFLAQFTTATLLAAWFAPGTYYLSLQFPIHIRCIGTAVSYNTGCALFGGVAPSICLALYQLTKNPIAPAGFLMFTALFAGASMLLIHSKNEREDVPNLVESRD